VGSFTISLEKWAETTRKISEDFSNKNDLMQDAELLALQR